MDYMVPHAPLGRHWTCSQPQLGHVFGACRSIWHVHGFQLPTKIPCHIPTCAPGKLHSAGILQQQRAGWSTQSQSNSQIPWGCYTGQLPNHRWDTTNNPKSTTNNRHHQPRKGTSRQGQARLATHNPRDFKYRLWWMGQQGNAHLPRYNTNQPPHETHWIPTPHHWQGHSVPTNAAATSHHSNQKWISEVPTNKIYESIQWQAFQIAFQWLATNKQQFISKLTHEWLPLQVSHIMANTSDQQYCPSCWWLLETPKHFLQCPHPTRQGIWEGFQQGVLKLTFKHNLPQPVQDIITKGYQLSRDPTQPTPHHLIQQASVQEAMQQQTNLGWKQLIYGCLTRAWTTLLHTQAPQINSNNFFSKLIYQGWMTLITIWKIQNTHLHPPNNNLNDCTQLYAIVENIFHMVHNNPILSTLLNYTTVDQIMQWSMRDIRKFIKHSTAHIHAHKEGAKKWATLNTNDIHSYL